MSATVRTVKATRLRSALGCLCAVLALGAVLAAPTLAAGELGVGQSFNELNQKAQEQGETTTTTKTSTTASTSTESNGASSQTLILVALGAVAVLSAIGFVIVRDARRVAPATDADMFDEKTSHDTAVRMRKRRAKAKAARKQRKRTR